MALKIKTVIITSFYIYLGILMSIFEPFTFREDIFPIILKVHDELLFPGQSNVLTPHPAPGGGTIIKTTLLVWTFLYLSRNV